jgi:hypothetical protein
MTSPVRRPASRRASRAITVGAVLAGPMISGCSRNCTSAGADSGVIVTFDLPSDVHVQVGDIRVCIAEDGITQRAMASVAHAFFRFDELRSTQSAGDSMRHTAESTDGHRRIRSEPPFM